MDWESIALYYGGKAEFRKATWDRTKIDDGNRKAAEVLRSTGFQSKRGVFLFGPAGTGKTHLLKCHFNSLIDWKLGLLNDGHSVDASPYWIKLSNYIEAIRAEDWKLKKRVMSATWLFLDDLGTSTTSEWAVDQVFQLLDERLERELQTFMTSNFNLEELAGKYHARVPSRIAEMTWPVHVSGQDRRILTLLKEQKERNE